MAIKKVERGKVLLTYKGFTVRQVPKYEGYGNERRMVSSTITIFIEKIQIQDGFKNPKACVDFIDKNLEYYDKKNKKFNLPKTEEE